MLEIKIEELHPYIKSVIKIKNELEIGPPIHNTKDFIDNAKELVFVLTLFVGDRLDKDYVYCVDFISRASGEYFDINEILKRKSCLLTVQNHKDTPNI